MELRIRLFLFTTFLIVGLVILLVFEYRDFRNLRLVFCDVGQGDGMLIQVGTKQVVVDGGSGSKIVDCLGDKMPFWDRTVEMVVLTHPQKDHLEGLMEVLGRYRVKTIMATGVKNETEIYRVWEEAVKKEDVRFYVPDVGDKLVLGRQGESLAYLEVLWPGRATSRQWLVYPPADLNETSIVMRLNFAPPNGKCAYLAGDIPKVILEQVIDRPCDILKVSHHGSKTGTSDAVLAKAKPKIAVIQSGKNSYGHPHEEVLGLLEGLGVKILRNDLIGTVEIVSDGRSLVTVD